MLNVELGKMSGGKYSLLPADGPAIRLSFGIPKSFAQDGKMSDGTLWEVQTALCFR